MKKNTISIPSLNGAFEPWPNEGEIIQLGDSLGFANAIYARFLSYQR
jgi:hypothetical protein